MIPISTKLLPEPGQPRPRFEPWQKEICIMQGKKQQHDAWTAQAQHAKHANWTNYRLAEMDHIRHVIGSLYLLMLRGEPDALTYGLLSLPWGVLPKGNKTILAPYKVSVPRVGSDLVLRIPENLPADTIVLLIHLGDIQEGEWEPEILGYSTRNEAMARHLGIWRAYGAGSHALCLEVEETNPFDESFPLYLPFDHAGRIQWGLQ